MLLHLDNKFLTVVTADYKSFMNGWELPLIRGSKLEMDINYRADDLGNITFES
jgi:hypothetical protein